MIVSILQKECASEKGKKNFKKQMHFNTKLCNNFAEIYDFGCSSKSRKKVSKVSRSCKKNKYIPKKKYYPSKFPKRREQYSGKEQSLLKR